MSSFPQLDMTHHRVLDMGRLEVNWDGNGASTIDPHSIQNASQALLFLVDKINPYQANPLPSGRVEYRWQGTYGELVIEITRKDRMVYTLIPEGACEFTQWSTGTIDNFNEMLALLLRIWLPKERSKPSCSKSSCANQCSCKPKIDYDYLPH